MISSTKNPKVAAALRLQKRAFRDEDRRFLVEGAQGIREALDHDPPAHRPAVRRRRAPRGRRPRAGAGGRPGGGGRHRPGAPDRNRDAPRGGRRRAVPGRRTRCRPRRMRGGVARRPRSGQRRHDPAVGGCRGSERRRLRRRIGRPVQPEDRPRLRRLDLPPSDRARRADARCDRWAAAPWSSGVGDGRAGLGVAVRDGSQRSGRIRVRQRSTRSAAGGGGARGRHRAGAPCGWCRVPQPRRGRNRVLVRPRAPSRRQGRVPGRVDRRGRARHPVAADRDEGVRVRARETLGRHDRRATLADAHRHRARRRPDGPDPPAARRRGAGLRRGPGALPGSGRSRRHRRRHQRHGATRP